MRSVPRGVALVARVARQFKINTGQISDLKAHIRTHRLNLWNTNINIHKLEMKVAAVNGTKANSHPFNS
jgi:hypothetical protein